MPELAEVEYFRRQWNCGMGRRVRCVELHSRKRIFRDSAAKHIAAYLPGSVLLGSWAHGKQMLFRFSRRAWLGIHLGMTGMLRAEGGSFKTGKHDHLVVYQSGRALVLSDPRLFGAVRFHMGNTAPDWWERRPPAIESARFTVERLSGFLHGHRRLPLKSALLLQDGFPGIGNWMADEVLWRAKIHPQTLAGQIEGPALRTLWKMARFVCRGAIRHISPSFGDPPSSWLFRERWGNHGECPRHRIPLQRTTIGGRTTVWCSACQCLPGNRDRSRIIRAGTSYANLQDCRV